MIDTMLLLGASVADIAKTAEQIIAVLQFFVGGILAGVVFFGVMSARKIKADPIAGIVMAALFGLPLIAISIAFGQSTIHPLLRILWLALLFLAWGLALSWAYRRLTPVEAEAVVGEDGTRAVERVGRRQFLIRLGAASAARRGSDQLQDAIENLQQIYQSFFS